MVSDQGIINPYAELKIEKLSDKNSQLSEESAETIKNLIKTRIFQHLKNTNSFKKVMEYKRNAWKLKRGKKINDLYDKERILADEAIGWDKNKDNIPRYHYSYGSAYNYVEQEILKEPEFQTKPNNGYSFQDALDELEIKWYSIPYGAPRTIERNHHSPIIAMAMIKPAQYAVGIVKTPRTSVSFELAYTYGHRATCKIITPKEALTKIESLKNAPIRIEENEKELEMLKQKVTLEAL